MKPSHELYARGLSLFLASLLLAVAAAFILIIGFGHWRAGRGTPTLLYVGFALAFVTWIVLLLSCAFGLLAFKRSDDDMAQPWLVMAFTLWIAATAIGLWCIYDPVIN